MSLEGIVATEIEKLEDIRGKRTFLQILEEDNLIEIPPTEAVTIVTHDNTYFVSSKGVINDIDQYVPYGLFLIYNYGYIRIIGNIRENYLPMKREKARPVAIIYFLNNPYLSERKVIVSWSSKCFSIEEKHCFYADCRI